MPHVILRYRLPEEQTELNAAMQGGEAKSILWDMDQYCRGILKHGQLGDEATAVARHIRQMIAEEPGLVE